MPDNEVVGRIRIELTGDQKVVQQLKATSAEQKNLIKTMGDIDRAQSSFRQVQSDIARVGTNAKATNAIIADLEDTVQELGRSKSIISLAGHFAQVGKATGDSYKQAKLYFDLLNRIGASKDDIEIAAASFNVATNGKRSSSDAQRSIAGVAQRAAGAIGLGGVSEISGIIDDVGDFTKAIGESGISAGKAALSLGLAGGALAAIAIAVKVFSDNLDKGARVVQQAADSVGVYYKAVQDGTTESIQDQLKAAQAQKKLVDDQIATIENARSKAVSGNDIIGKVAFAAADALGKLPKTDELAQEAAKAQAEIDGLTRALNSSEVAANNAAAAYEAESKAILASLNEQASQTLRFRQAEASLEDQSADSLEKRAKSLKDEIKNTTEYLHTLESTGEPSEELDKAINQTMLDLQLMTGTLDKIEKTALPAAKANEAYAKSLKDAQSAADEYAKTSKAISDLDAARAKQLADQARADSRNRQISALETQIAAAKEQEAEQERKAKIVDLREKAGQEEIEAAAKNAADERKINADFMAESLKAQRSFALEQSRSEEDFGRERLRKLRDLTASLSELAAKGDISGFISTQRSGVNDLRDSSENQTVAARRRLEDFRIENEERINQRNQRLAELQQSFAAETAQRQQNLQQQLNAEAEAGKARVLQSQILEKQLADLRQQFAAEDAARTLADQQSNYEQQRAALIAHQKEQAEIIRKGTQPVIDAAKNLVRGVNDELNRAIANLRAGQQMARSGGAGGAKMHDLGAVYTQPTTALSSFAEKPGRGDAVMPFNLNEGWRPMMQRLLSQSGGSGGGAPVNVYITTGSVATQQDIAEIKSGVVQAVQVARQRGK